MAAKNPGDVARKWANNLAGAGDTIRRGVAATTVAPTQQAAAAHAKYLANVQKNVGKWQERLQAVTLGDWQRAMTDKALPRIATGAQVSEPKFQAFLTQLLPYIESNKAAIDAMPSLTLEDSVNRAAAWIRTMSKFSYRR